jgi:osmotically inducible protein OsmC
MPIRSAQAEWRGNLREGDGTMKLPSGAYEGPYTFGSRFEEATGSNPEELIAAAHAGCFSMQLSGVLGRAGFTPTRINTTAKVHLDRGDTGFSITRIDLETEAEVPGIDDATFQTHAEEAKKICPVSRALAAISDIRVNAKLL